MRGMVDEMGLVVRQNCVNAGEWTSGVAVIGIKISINWRGIRGISFDWIRCWDRSAMETNCVLP